MTDVEIWHALQTIRDTLIQSREQMDSTIDQLEILAEEIQKGIKVT